MKLVFKKMLLILGLIAIFASILQQNFDRGASDSLGSVQTSAVQLDKDDNRDNADIVTPTVALNLQHPEKTTVYYFYSVSYQEPSLLVHLRPPNA